MSKLSEQQEKFYVYLYRIDGEIAYVGKGKGSRAYSHLNKARNPILRQRILEGRSVRVKIIKRDMTEGDAFRLERRCINKWSATVSNMTQGTRTEVEALYAQCLTDLKHNLRTYGEAIMFSNGNTYSLKHRSIQPDTYYHRITNLAWIKRQLRSSMRTFEKIDPSLKEIKISEASYA